MANASPWWGCDQHRNPCPLFLDVFAVKRYLSLMLLLVLFYLWFGRVGADETATSPTLLAGPATPSMEAPSAAPSSTSMDAEVLRKQAFDHWQADEREQALVLLDQACIRSPSDVDNYWVRGQILGELRLYGAAIADLRRVTELAPYFAKAWGLLGWYLLLQGDSHAAQVASTKAQTISPDWYAWTINFGHSYLLQVEQETTHDQYQKSLPLIPNEEAMKFNLLIDFGLFIDQGWRITASREDWAWLDTADRQAIREIRRETEPQHLAHEHWKKGLENFNLAQYPHALEHYQQALAIYREIGNRQGEGANLTGIGSVYLHLYQYSEALEYHQQGLAIHREIGDREGEGWNLHDIGIVYSHLAQYPQALEYFQQSLAISREIGDRQGEGADLTGIGIVYSHLAQYSQALENFQQALGIARAIGNRRDEGIDLAGIGDVFSLLARYPQALEYFQQALAISREIGNRHEEGANFTRIGSVYLHLYQYSQALEYHQQALAIHQEIGDHGGVDAILGNIGNIYQRLAQYPQALDYYQQALAISRETGAHGHEAQTLAVLARPQSNLGYLGQAVATLSEVLTLAITTGEPNTLQYIQDSLRQTLAKQSQTTAAIFFGKQAVNTIQGMRGLIVKMDKSLQQSFLGEKEQVYKGLADLLLDQGRLAEAEQVLAMLKEEELYDFLRRDAGNREGTQAAYSQAEVPWRERFQKISGQMIALGQEYDALKNKKKLGLDANEEARLRELDKDMQAGRKAVLAYLDELRETFAQMGSHRAIEFGEKELQSLTALQGTLKQLGDGVVLVYTLMTDTRLRMIVTTANAPPVHRESAVTAKELTDKITEFRSILTRRPLREPRPLGRELYQWIIAPIADDLRQAKAKVIMVSLDDVLRYLPLAALYDGQHYLVEDYGVVVFTAAARGGLATPPQPNWRMAGLGLSEVSDKVREEGFSSLPAVADELNGLIRWEGRQDAGGVLPGVRYLNQEFTPTRLAEVLNQSYPVIHLASHFHFQPGVETDSYLLLGDGGKDRLTMDAFRSGDYPLTEVDLLTLSACQTAMSDKDAKGKELEGFGAMAQNQGAKAVMATLWSVDDASTGLFMQHFYRLRQDQHLTKAEALRQAQLTLLRGDNTTASPAVAETGRGEVIRFGKAGENSAPAFFADPAHPYAHPYYWAPFILMGNWL
ncbi:hypothetical protein CCP4SC76_6090003 [Gammaproteobacteria bacterium]